MIKCPARLVLTAIFGFTFAGATTAQPSCVECGLYFEEAYSNADASAQFLMFVTYGPSDGISHLAGLTLVAKSGATENTFRFPMDLPNPAGRPILVATQGFADLHLVSPDFIVPNGFLFVRNGTIDVRPGSWGFLGTVSYAELPTDGVTGLYLSCDESSFGTSSSCWLSTATAWAMNSSGRSYTFPVPAITPAFAGNWFDPAQSGQGLFLEVLPNNRVLAGWFAFNPAGTEQAWFVGVGTYSGNTATIDSVLQPTGGRWIPNFDPSRIANSPWGTLTLTFSDCNHGRVAFTSILGYGVGSMNLTRLTQPAGLSCQ